MAALVKDEPVRDKNYFNQKLSGWHQTSYAYFRDKSLIGSVRTLIGDRKLVENDEVSQYLIDALISTEDREFYNHSGIVPRSLLRAVYEDLTNQKVVTGGSTITQQLVKRAILENYSKTYDRKAKEILLALRLERMYSKEEILNAYLNSLYFGTGSGGQHLYGVQAAAQGIFGVDAKDLNIAQAAYLAGMIQRPNDFNPFKKEGLERGKKRMKMVLDNMLDNGKITQQQYEEGPLLRHQRIPHQKEAKRLQPLPLHHDGRGGTGGGGADEGGRPRSQGIEQKRAVSGDASKIYPEGAARRLSHLHDHRQKVV